MKRLEDRVLEVAKIAQECPENLQQSCFEILLKHVLSTEESPPSPSAAPPVVDGAKARIEPKNVVEESAKKQDERSFSKDMLDRVKAFLDELRTLRKEVKAEKVAQIAKKHLPERVARTTALRPIAFGRRAAFVVRVFSAP